MAPNWQSDAGCRQKLVFASGIIPHSLHGGNSLFVVIKHLLVSAKITNFNHSVSAMLAWLYIVKVVAPVFLWMRVIEVANGEKRKALTLAIRRGCRI